jgi:hypothetical protein
LVGNEKQLKTVTEIKRSCLEVPKGSL